MTAPTTMRSEGREFFERLRLLHGHRCPMSIFGARLGLAARDVVGRHGERGDVRAVYHHRTCALDGIQLALGTTLGNHNLESVPDAEHVLEAENAGTGERVVVTLTDEALALGKQYAGMKRAGTDPETLESFLLELEAMDQTRLVKPWEPEA